MKSGVGWQLELISNWVDFLLYQIRAIEMVDKFLESPAKNGLLAIWLEFEEDTILLFKLNVPPFLVSLLLHVEVCSL